MKAVFHRSFRWHPGPPAWGPALVAGAGCGVPLVLGLFSDHTGFLWAATGAFQASLANPLHRFGMLRMFLLIILGAISAGLGFWVAAHAWMSLACFALFGLLLAWLQRHGSELGKLGVGLAVCLCLGQGQHGSGSIHSGTAVGALFAIGGAWVMFLAFMLRGLHGLPVWPQLPRFRELWRVMRLHAGRLPERLWRIHALGCGLACALAGVTASLTGLPRGYWLTLTVVTTLQQDWNGSLDRALQRCFASLVAAGILIAAGHYLHSPASVILLMIPLITLSRAYLSHHYALFVLQATVCFILLAESLSSDWHLGEVRLINTLLGASLALLVSGLCVYLRGRAAPQSAPDDESAKTTSS